MIDAFLSVQRALVAIAFAGSALLVWPSRSAAYGLPKATLVLLVVVLTLVVSAARIVLARRLEIPKGPVVWLGLAVVAAMAVATALSPTPLVSLMGSERQTGSLLYVAYFMLALASVRAFRGGGMTVLTRSILTSTGLVALYGLAQAIGWQPLPFGIFSTPVFSTLGNSNFMSGWLALAAPVALWSALGGEAAPAGEQPSSQVDRRSWPVLSYRWGAAGLYSLVMVVILASRSFQGVPAVVFGSIVVLAVWISQEDRWKSARRRFGVLSPRSTRLVAIALVLVALAVGSLAAGWVVRQAASGLGPRLDYWSAASRLAGDHLVSGTGPDTFDQHYAAYYRTVSDVPYEFTDNPHSVPLAMLVSGGVPLLITYLGFVGVTAWALVRGLSRKVGEHRFLLGALGGAWVAYQVQSLVSVDIPPLAVAHWVLAGVIAVLSGSLSWREVSLGADPARSLTRQQRRRGVTRTPVAAGIRVVLAGILAVGLAGLLLAVRPMRAVAAADEAEDRLEAGQTAQALAVAHRATELAPWQARNWFLLGRSQERSGDIEDARRSAERATKLAPGLSSYALIAAELAQKAQDHEEAAGLYTRALRADPRNQEVVADVARAYLLYGRREEAHRILRSALRRSETAELWGLEGRAFALDGDMPSALDAYRKALALDPSHKEAANYVETRGG